MNLLPDSPLMVHHGERKLMYRWFFDYFNDRIYSDDIRCRSTSDLMLMYLLIKNKIRREFIQTNNLVGFGNFKDFDSAKFAYTRFDEKYSELMFRYAVQTSLDNSLNLHLEARIMPDAIKKFQSMDYCKSIFAKETKHLQPDKHHPLTFVAHFTKSPDNSVPDGLCLRHSDLRKRLTKQTRLLLRDYASYVVEGKPKLVGIDAAGSELNCRPEVFAPFFRLARSKGLTNFTYHAGEDFYDIVDGLRSVDELVKFMDYRSGDRIGHGLALGINVYDFYDERHNTMIIPRQMLLDNLVWLKYKASLSNIQLSPQTLLFIEEQFCELTSILKYPDCSIHNYYLSMNLRGDLVSDTSSLPWDIDPDVRQSPVSTRQSAAQIVIDLWNHYERSEACRRKGSKVLTRVLPKSFVQDVANVQECMLSELESLNVVIETNPSSNIKIGRFKRYDQHPLTRFHGIDGESGSHSMVVSINTDDKGIFYTSLKNEYSLIAAALRKERTADGLLKWTDTKIENYIRRIAHYGNISRFKPTYEPSDDEYYMGYTAG
ncbi:MAG: hypothetical protein NC453_17045 [Muribaculum sp.]|nr:hypothetical protein [Muribaculum sp.]